jgi:thiol:disulfide interchange protein
VAIALAALLVASPAPRAHAGPGDGSFLERMQAQAAPDGANVVVSVAASKTVLRPGDQFVVAVIFDHAEGWHVHTNAPVVPPDWDFTPIPTVITPAPMPGLRVGQTQWPPAYEVMVDLVGSGKPEPYKVFKERAIAFVPLMIEPDATPGVMELTFRVAYQACNDVTCDIPQDETHTLRVQVDPPLVAGTGDPNAAPAPGGNEPARDPSVAEPAPPSTFAGFDTSVFAQLAAGVVASERDDVDFGFFGYSFTLNAAGTVGMLLLLLVAMLGGFLLNLTPCVLPVIPIKIMSLSHAAGNPRRAMLLGLVMSGGVVAFWLLLGALIATLTGFKAINQLFQLPWFSIGVGLFIAAMGIGMLGLFTVQLPQAVYMLDPKRESIPGSFIFGVMTAVLSTPCTAPFMGTAAAWAAKQPAALTMLTFAAIGLGMALPYLVLSFAPGLVKRVPRSGPGSELVKQVMGLLMLAVAAFFVGTGLDPLIRLPIDDPVRLHWFAVAGLTVLAFGWMIWRMIRLRSRPLTLGVLGSLGVAASAGITYFAIEQNQKGPIDWVAYTPERFAERVAAGDVVVLEFTAEWCLNCKALEKAVLHRPEVVALLQRPGVVPMKVDLTGNNVPGQDKLQSLNWVGIPLLAIFGPATPEPQKFDTYTVPQVVAAVERAQAGAASASAAGLAPGR